MAKPLVLTDTDARPAHSTFARAKGYLRLTHPFPVAANAVAAVAFGAVAARGWPGGRAALLLALAIIGSQATVGVVNDLRDRDLDAAEKPHKPLVSGRVSVPGAYMLGAAMLALALVAGAMLGPVSVPLVLAMTAAGVVYDLWLKRTAASFVPYIFGLPLLPIWAWVCVREADPRLWLTYPLGVLVGFGLHLANALPDAGRRARFRAGRGHADRTCGLLRVVRGCAGRRGCAHLGARGHAGSGALCPRGGDWCHGIYNGGNGAPHRRNPSAQLGSDDRLRDLPRGRVAGGTVIVAVNPPEPPAPSLLLREV